MADPDPGPPLDVLVVGAGPTGLALACELARRGVDCRLVDREPGPAATSRALVVHPRTRETFDLMGIPPSRLRPSLEVAALVVADGPRPLARLAFRRRRPGRPYDGILALPQRDSERILAEHLGSLGDRVEWSTALVGLDPRDDHVVATLRRGDREETLRARWLVGADGARSTVRDRAGIPFAGDALHRFLVGDLRLGWGIPPDEARLVLADRATLAAIPLPDPGWWQVVVALPDAPDLPAASATACQTLLRDLAGDPTVAVREARGLDALRVREGMAAAYRRGRVLLAGDAAHAHGPIGGQGMNTGVQDAFNLGWKLALAVAGTAAPGLLDTYEAERAPVARAVLRATGAGSRVALADHPLVRGARDLVLPVVLRGGGAQSVLAEHLTELGVSYRGGPLAEPEPERRGVAGWLAARRPGVLRPGDRAPQAHAQTLPAANPVTLFDLYASGRFTVLLFAGDHPGRDDVARLIRIEEAIDGRRDALGRAFVVVRDPDLLADAAGAGRVLLDRSGEMHRLYDAEPGAGWLVRPDGYLACRFDPARADAELRAYMARVVTPEALA